MDLPTSVSLSAIVPCMSNTYIELLSVFEPIPFEAEITTRMKKKNINRLVLIKSRKNLFQKEVKDGDLGS
jgi:hypothetical protein